MRYCSRSRRFHPDPGTKHISVPPRHMTKPYAPDFQHDITTIQIQGYNISYNRHTTASNTIQQRKIHVWVQTTCKCLVAKRKHRSHNHTGPGPPPGSAYLVVVESPREPPITILVVVHD